MSRGVVIFVSLGVLGLFVGNHAAVAANVALLGHGGGTCSGVAVSGQYAYVTDFSGFSVFDISNPGTPALRGHLLLPDSADHAGRMAVSDNRVYVPWSSGIFAKNGMKAATAGGFRVVDVSDPATPRLIASYAAPGGMAGIAVRGNIVYAPWLVVDVNAFTFLGGFRVLDMSDPAAPVLLGQIDTGASTGVVLDGNKAYVPRFGGVAIIDITTSATPTLLGSYSSGVPISIAWDLVLSGSTFYCVQTKTTNGSSCSYTLETVNASNPAAPIQTGSCTLYSFNSLIVDVMGLALSGNRAFVANNEAGLQVVDVANAASPQLVASRLMRDEALGVALSGSTAYVAGGHAGLEVVGVADPANPVLQRTCLVGGPGKTVITGGHAYSCWENHFHRGTIWRHSGGIRITSVPGMGEITAIDTPGKAWSVATSGGRTYSLWNDDENLDVIAIEIYDIGNLAAPVRLGSYTTPHRANSIVANGNIVYIANGSEGLDIVDLADPANPVLLLDSFLGNPPIEHLKMEDNFLYSWASGGTTLLDVSDPHAPITVQNGSWGFGEFLDAKMQGNTTFLVTLGYLEIINRDYGIIGEFSTDGAGSVAVSGRLAYLGKSSGITVVDLINPVAPRVLGSYDYPGLNAGLCAKDGTAYVSDEKRGLFALRYTGSLDSDLRATFDSQWAALCDSQGWSPDSADLNGDGLPERWALRLLQTVLDDAKAPGHESACATYIDNLAEFVGQVVDPPISDNRKCVAALLMMGVDIRDYMTGLFTIPGTYQIAAGEPFSGTADIDHDGLTNAQECAAVAGWGGTIDAFPEMALYRYGAGPVPIADVVGLAVLLCLTAILGVRGLRRGLRKA